MEGKLAAQREGLFLTFTCQLSGQMSGPDDYEIKKFLSPN